MLTTLLGKNGTLAQEMLEEILGTNMKKLLLHTLQIHKGTLLLILSWKFHSIQWACGDTRNFMFL